MLTEIGDYTRELVDSTGRSWNQFWFTPSSGIHLVVLRHVVGVFSLLWIASFTSELVEMFGSDGWITPLVVHQTTTDGDPTQPAPGFSHLFLADSSWFIWGTHVASIVVAGLVSFGVRPPVTTPLLLVIVLSYVHRAPMLTSTFETVLCMLLAYLSIAPSGNVSGLRRGEDEPGWTKNLVTRLIQVHLCGIYALIAASKLGTPAWWTADACWYLLTDTQHRLVALDALTSKTMLLNGVSHIWLAIEVLFPILIWIGKLRPLLLLLVSGLWLGTALLTGQVAYCVLMLAANLAFVSPNWLGKRISVPVAKAT